LGIRFPFFPRQALDFEDSRYRHQIVEIPPIVLEIVEHRLHERVCDNCGQKTRAVLPPEVETSGYGERVVAKSVIDEWDVSAFSPYGSVSPVGLFWIENRIRNSESIKRTPQKR
jgi:hypothetical protein